MEIVRNRLRGLFFIDGNLTGGKYLGKVNHQIIPALQQNGQLPQNSCFQQDGAPPYYDRPIRHFFGAYLLYR